MKAKNSTCFLERYTIAIYFVITFLITIILGAIYQFTQNVFISPQYAPTIGLLIVCVMSKNWSVWGKMNWCSFKRPKNLLRIFIALSLPIIIILISSMIMSLLGTQFVPWQDTKSRYFITIVTAILGSIFEEIGWRGYLLPKFAEKNMFHSAIGVGLLWGVWHCNKIIDLIDETAINPAIIETCGHAIYVGRKYKNKYDDLCHVEM